MIELLGEKGLTPPKFNLDYDLALFNNYIKETPNDIWDILLDNIGSTYCNESDNKKDININDNTIILFPGTSWFCYFNFCRNISSLLR